jgi:hypothetical protein
MNIILSNYSQPYLYKDTNINLLCCFSPSLIEDYFDYNMYYIRPWKIHIFKNIDINIPASTRVNLPEYIDDYGNILLECNPCIYKNSNIMTYTCGFKKHPKSEICYYFAKVEIENNSYKNFQILSKTFNAIIYNDYIYQISKDQKSIEVLSFKTLEKINNFIIVKDSSFSIYRITKVYNSEDLILTMSSPNSVLSLLVDSNMSIKKILKDNNNDIYKCSLYDNYLAYTIKDTNGIQENRSIKIIDDYNALLC